MGSTPIHENRHLVSSCFRLGFGALKDGIDKIILAEGFAGAGMRLVELEQ
jgi:hypothetical protein